MPAGARRQVLRPLPPTRGIGWVVPAVFVLPRASFCSPREQGLPDERNLPANPGPAGGHGNPRQPLAGLPCERLALAEGGEVAAVSRLISGQTVAKVPTACMVPVTWRQES